MNNKSLEQLFDIIFSKNIFEQKILVLHYILTGSETRSEFNYYIINYKIISWRCTLFQIIMGDGVCLLINKLKNVWTPTNLPIFLRPNKCQICNF